MPHFQKDMEIIVSQTDTKSEKIRKLGAAGYSRRQIADFLGVRYQFVRNVLVEEERKRGHERSGLAEPTQAWRPQSHSAAGSHEPYGGIRVQPDGSAVVPASALAQAGLHPGDCFVPVAVGEGDLRLLAGEAALKYAQELVRRYVPENADLVQELLEDRRREAEKFEREIENRPIRLHE